MQLTIHASLLMAHATLAHQLTKSLLHLVCCDVQAFAALPPGGAFIALDLVIDDERRGNVWGLLMSLDMLMEFDAERAFDYTFKASGAHTP